MGKIVNNYELLEQLGQGGMGVVYKARHIHFDEIYALKRLWEQFGANEMVLNLFLNEAKILRKLNHKNIVHVTDVFSLENQNYIVMEYIKGRSLDEIIKKEVGPIRRERAINLFKQMLEGIAYIHDQPTPIIHRDIKPLNLLVTEDDTVKITDFGIAKVLDAGQNASTVVKGTPVYMSPEQILNPKSVDIRTDVYSLGMTFYEMLCGRTPFSGDTTTTPTAVYAAIINSEVPPPTHFYPGITEALSDFVMKAIHKDRNQRFSDANEMLRKLEELERSGDTIFEDISKIVPACEEEEPELINNRELKQVTNTSRENRIQRRKWFIEIAAVCLIFLAVGLPWQQIFEKVVESIKQDSIPLVEKTSLLTSNQMKEMVVVDGGTFMMGTNDGKYDYDKPVHEVTVGSFLIGKYEVTQDFWESIMGSNPSEFKSGKKPVENVSWYDAIEFCNKLSEKEGLQKAYKIDRSKKDPNNNSQDDKVKWVVTCDFNSNGYRLPTEAEWEFAAKGGNQSKGYKYSGSNDIDEVAWYSKNTNKTTQDIGIKHPNELEIFDMSGNIWEWCWEWNGDYTSQSQTNPKGAKTGTFRVLRGGVWMLEDIYCRAAHSYGDVPDARVSIFGFRLARTKN